MRGTVGRAAKENTSRVSPNGGADLPQPFQNKSKSDQQPCTPPSTAQRGPLRPFDGSRPKAESTGGDENGEQWSRCSPRPPRGASKPGAGAPYGAKSAFQGRRWRQPVLSTAPTGNQQAAKTE